MGCLLCNDKKWHGWLHDRQNWFWFPWCREVMLRAHYPMNCGVGEAYEREGGYLYPMGYLAG